MGEPLILTFDMGTQSARALLVDKHGAVVAMTQEKYEEPYYSKYPGWAEQKPDFYYHRLCRTGRELCKKIRRN